MRRKFIFGVVLITFIANMVLPYGVSAHALDLPAPDQLLFQSSGYSLPMLKGLKLDPKNPLKIDFIIDTANQGKVDKEEVAVLIRYFLAGIAMPDKDIWVNLSPYEQERIVPQALGETDLGRDLLAQDYVLKQLAASLTYPESESGKKYWDEIQDKGSSQSASVNNFQKVWIIPGKAKVYEHQNMVVVKDATLQVKTEEDCLATQNNLRADDYSPGITVFKTCILPMIEQDVNHGKNFAQLRQIYSALVLAKWFKEKFKASFYRWYINSANNKGIGIEDKGSKDKIYAQYVEAFQKGVYNYVKSDRVETRSGASFYRTKIINHAYFSGGVEPMPDKIATEFVTGRKANGVGSLGPLTEVTVVLGQGSDSGTADSVATAKPNRVHFVQAAMALGVRFKAGSSVESIARNILQSFTNRRAIYGRKVIYPQVYFTVSPECGPNRFRALLEEGYRIKMIGYGPPLYKIINSREVFDRFNTYVWTILGRYGLNDEEARVATELLLGAVTFYTEKDPSSLNMTNVRFRFDHALAILPSIHFIDSVKAEVERRRQNFKEKSNGAKLLPLMDILGIKEVPGMSEDRVALAILAKVQEVNNAGSKPYSPARVAQQGNTGDSVAPTKWAIARLIDKAISERRMREAFDAYELSAIYEQDRTKLGLAALAPEIFVRSIGRFLNQLTEDGLLIRRAHPQKTSAYIRTRKRLDLYLQSEPVGGIAMADIALGVIPGMVPAEFNGINADFFKRMNFTIFNLRNNLSFDQLSR